MSKENTLSQPDSRSGLALLVIGRDVGIVAIREQLEAIFTVTERRLDSDDLHRFLADPDFALIVFHGMDAPDLVKGLDALAPAARVIISGTAPGAQIRADPRVVFEIPPEIAPDQLAGLLTSVGGASITDAPLLSPDDAKLQKRVLDIAANFTASRDPARAVRAVSAELCELLDADRVHCLYHDAASGTVWTPAPIEREHRTTRGLASYVARTGRGLWILNVGQDWRYVAAIDDPGGDGSEQLLVAPICGADGAVHALVVAVRRAHRADFDARERGCMGLFIRCAGPMIEHLARHQELDEVLLEHEQREHEVFRVEALRERRAGERPGRAIRVTGAWVPVSYWLVLSFVIVGLGYLMFGRINIYSAGPAVVNLHERRQVSARASGSLTEILVEPGQRVEAGQLLARLDDAHARSELHRAELSFRAELRARLLEPDDPRTAAGLPELRRQRDNARAALAERELRAPVTGVVGDIRIRPGQHVELGEILLSLMVDEHARRVFALLPGADRPQLRAGMVMRIELPGFSRAYQYLHVQHVGKEVVGPNEARRFLGPTQADALALDGPMVLVEAELADAQFVVDGQRYSYHEGMLARAEVRVRAESLLEMLFPALRGVLPHVR